MRDRKIAVIDLGTNTFNLLIASIKGDVVDILYKDRSVVLLGKDGFESNKIMPEAMVRAIEALKFFNTLIEKYEIAEEDVFATGTSAIRNASNMAYFKQKIHKKTGIKVQVINGEEEAILIYKGVKQILPLFKEPSLIVDIGGGSVEFVLCNENELLWQQSFEIGAQRLLNKFHHHEPMLKQESSDMRRFFSDNLQPLLAACKKFQPVELIGSSGSFDTLGAVVSYARGLSDYSEESTFYFTKEEFDECHCKIATLNKKDRLMIPGMHPMRVEMIVVASYLIDYLLSSTGINNIRVSPYAIKEGFLEEIIESYKCKELNL